MRPIEDFADVIQQVDMMNRKVAEESGQGLAQNFRYLGWSVSPNNTLCCLAPYIYTWAILDDVSVAGFKRRWCYGSLLEATLAMADWHEKGGEAPKGFIRAV